MDWVGLYETKIKLSREGKDFALDEGNVIPQLD